MRKKQNICNTRYAYGHIIICNTRYAYGHIIICNTRYAYGHIIICNTRYAYGHIIICNTCYAYGNIFVLQEGWSGGAKVLCILRHLGVQLILAESWARPVILVASKGRGGCFYFFCFFTFIPVPLSSLFLSFISSTISSISFSLSLGDDTK